MVQTRLDTKFTCWTFTLRRHEFFPCIKELSNHCENLSYGYCERHGYHVNCEFKTAERYDDVFDGLGYFAKNIYPCSKYIVLPNFLKTLEEEEDEFQMWYNVNVCVAFLTGLYLTLVLTYTLTLY